MIWPYNTRAQGAFGTGIHYLSATVAHELEQRVVDCILPENVLPFPDERFKLVRARLVRGEIEEGLRRIERRAS